MKHEAEFYLYVYRMYDRQQMKKQILKIKINFVTIESIFSS